MIPAVGPTDNSKTLDRELLFTALCNVIARREKNHRKRKELKRQLASIREGRAA